MIIENLSKIKVNTKTEINDMIYKGILKGNTNRSTMKEYTTKSHNIIAITIFCLFYSLFYSIDY